MKSPIHLLIAAILAAPLTTLTAADHHHGAASHTLELNAGKKWKTDEPLRQAMNAIKTSAAATLPAAHAGNADYAAFGKEVATQVSDIVKHCKLAPKADAQLHIVIGDLMAGVDMARKENKPSGVVKVVEALNTYGKYFDHPGWKPLTLSH